MLEKTELRAIASHRTAAILGLWSFWYVCYRGYYAAGGQFGLIGRPVSDTQLRAINAFGAAVILALAVVLPVVAVRVGPLYRLLPTLGWVAAVGCCMHALVDATLRLLSVAGVHPTQLPADVWQSFDRHAADWQDLLLNEPWFLVEGLLWAVLGCAYLRRSRRRAWLISAGLSCAVLTVIGVLSGVGALGSFHLA